MSRISSCSCFCFTDHMKVVIIKVILVQYILYFICLCGSLTYLGERQRSLHYVCHSLHRALLQPHNLCCTCERETSALKYYRTIYKAMQFWNGINVYELNKQKAQAQIPKTFNEQKSFLTLVTFICIATLNGKHH